MTPASVRTTRWYETAERLGISLERIAVETGRSFSAVYRYKQGTRTPPAEWLAAVEALLAAHDAPSVETDNLS